MPSEDAQEVAEILDAVTGRVPNLLRSILDQLYSPDAGRRMGQAIGAFYRELIEAGLPPERALQLAEDYASPFGIVRSVLGDDGGAVAQGMSWSGRRQTRGGGREGRAASAGPAPLEAWFNNAGTSGDGAAAAADLDGVGWSLSAQALAEAGVMPGGTVTVDGLTFRWPAAAPGRPDNVDADGQEVRLPARPGSRRLGFLALATHGPWAGRATLHYADGRTQSIALSFPDWTLNGGEEVLPAGTRVAVRMPRRNSQDGEGTQVETMVFASIVPLQPEASVKSVTLPARADQGALHVFAVALGD